MFLADSHLHSLCSSDCKFTMAEMAEAGIRGGLNVMTVTDHVDLTYEMDGSLDGYCFCKWPDMQEDFYEANGLYGDRIELRIGIELGGAHHHPHLARQIAKTSGLGFVIGSLHNLRNTTDFYYLKYKSREQCQSLAARYFEETKELAASDGIDVIGHIGYFRRYMLRDGFDVSLDDYNDMIREVFGIAIANGVGIEANTSGIWQGLGSTIPDSARLKMYKECGGEMITVGSDSHTPDTVGAGIAETYGVLRDIGFRYVTVFKNRRPEFIKL